MKGIIFGNVNDSGDIWFGEEGLAVVYLGNNNGGLGGIIKRYIANRRRKLIKHILEISELIYW